MSDSTSDSGVAMTSSEEDKEVPEKPKNDKRKRNSVDSGGSSVFMLLTLFFCGIPTAINAILVELFGKS